MTLQDIFEQLAFGELKSLRLGGSENQEIPTESYRNVIAHINLGLKELYKRFWLSSKELTIRIYNHIRTYELDRKYAQSNTDSEETYKYILDTNDPFYNDLLKIEQVFNEDCEELPLNDSTDADSLFTPTYKKISVPTTYTDTYLRVQYRNTPPVIEFDPGDDPTDVEVDLPEGLLEALCLYVGYRAQSAIGGAEAQQEAMLLQQRFELSCQLALDRGIGVTTSLSNTKLDTNGWV